MKKIIIVFIVLMSFVLFASDEHKGHRHADGSFHKGEHTKSEKENHDDHKHSKKEHEEESHDGHGHDDEHEDIANVSKKNLEDFGVQFDVVAFGDIHIEKRVTGEVGFNENKLSHITPIISGKVKKVYKNLGDKVKAGDRIALIESRELAELKTMYLSTKERKKLMKSNFDRENRLWKKKITSEKSYLEAKNDLAEMNIQLLMVKNKLLAIGLSSYQVERIKSDRNLALHTIKAPVDGVVIKKHISIGEYIKDETSILTIADLSHVWVQLNLYQSDLKSVLVGNKVVVESKKMGERIEGSIDYLTPFIDDETKTATARVVIRNHGKWYPGMFIHAYVKIKKLSDGLIVKKEAIQSFEGKQVVFVKKEEGIKPIAVTLGKSDSVHIQVLSGLQKGDSYVSKHAFSIKSELEKASFGDGHAH